MVLLSHPFQSTLPLRGVTPRTSPRSRRRRNFNPHSPCGERRQGIPSILPSLYFNPHSPCGERHARTRRHRDILCYFNPHSPCGERHKGETLPAQFVPFQSTLPLRGATPELDVFDRDMQFQSTLPLRGATCRNSRRRTCRQFQSTLPLRGATCTCAPCRTTYHYFNPHSPCGERQLVVSSISSQQKFQSTLPLRGATWVTESHKAPLGVFQSTLPLRGATLDSTEFGGFGVISIHTPLAGSDGLKGRKASVTDGFQSTLPLRGATTGVLPS